MFLSTTALSEFWDSSQKITFLGEWCKLDSNKELWKNIESETQPYLWENIENIQEAITYCNNVYENLLQILTIKLNKVHKLHKEKEYWEILLGNWLATFIQVIYDRYINLENFIEKYPNFETILLAEDSYITPIEYSDFIKNIFDDSYNLQIYSQILKEQGYIFPLKSLPIEQQTHYAKQRSLKKLIFQTALNSLNRKKNITLTSPYFSREIRSCIKLILESKGKIKFYDFDDSFCFNIKINTDMRKILKHTDSSLSEFEKVLFNLLEINLPLLFLEGFSAFRSFALSKETEKTPIYATANALHSNYLYKFWIAENKKDIKLVSIQHGGGYGIDAINMFEIYERKIVDFFFTWGWVETAKTIQTGHEKISQHTNRCNTGYILYTTTALPRYNHYLTYSYTSSTTKTAYIPKAISFLKSAGDVKRFLIRSLPVDNGFNMDQNIKMNFPNILFDNHSKKFYQSLKHARLFITDHLATTYLETLSMNFPTIVFIDKERYSFRTPDYIKLLEDAKILFYDEIEAANHLNTIYEDIDRWWFSDQVQNARKLFCHHYAKPSKNWAQDWMNSFNAILER